MYTNLYHITEFSFNEGQILASVQLNSAHAIFAGHFPGQPVFPGVCQLALLKELVERAVSQTLTMHAADQVKFMAMVTPSLDTVLTADVKITSENGVYTAQAVMKNGEDVFLKTKARYS